jgi:cell division protein FtsQ
MTNLLERIRQPHDASMPRHRARWLVLVTVLVLAAVAAWLIGFSSVLGVRTVAVTGERRVSTEQILAAAGIRHGAPLSRLDTAGIRDRVAALPAIRTVTVHSSYPSRVSIRVTERVAVGYRPDDGGSVLVDADNVQFATVGKALGLPELQISGDPAVSAAAAAVAGALPRTFLSVVGSISVPTMQSISLKLTDGRTVLWGGTDRSAEKAKLVPVLIHQPGTYFDVSDPSSVISRGA